MHNSSKMGISVNSDKNSFLYRLGRGKNLGYIAITLVLLVVALILYFNDSPGTLKLRNDAFAVTDTSVVTSVRFSVGKNTVILDRSGSNWTVNGQFNARPMAVKALLGVLNGFEIGAPVSKTMKSAVTKSFEKGALSVEIESSGKVLKAYLIVEDIHSKVGSFMMLRGDDQPYLVKLPGYDGRITKLFPCNQQFWRDNIIFRYSPADILSVDVDYPANSKASFVYQFKGPNGLEIRSKQDNKTVKISKEAARNYLIGFASVSFEMQVRSRSKEIFDSLNHTKPYCQIQVKNAGNQINIIKTYRIAVRSQSSGFDVNRMYAVHQNDTIPVIIKYIDFDPIMKEFDDFSGY